MQVDAENMERVKDKLNSWNANFFDNFENYIVRVLNNERSDEIIAFFGVVTVGYVVECFHDWEFKLPRTYDVVKYLSQFDSIEDVPATMQMIPWSKDNNAEAIMCTIGSLEEIGVMRRFLIELIGETVA